jgi:hypothetical protein
MDDFQLLISGSLGAARAGRLNRQMQRQRSQLPETHIDPRSVFQKTSNGGGTPRSNGPVQWRCSPLVCVIDICAMCDEEIDEHRLTFRIPRVPSRRPRIARIVQRDRTTPISRVNLGAMIEKEPRRIHAQRCSSQMERRIAAVEPMRNRFDEVVRCNTRTRDFRRRRK